MADDFAQGTRIRYVESLPGALSEGPSSSQPAGANNSQKMRVSATFREGKPIGWSRYRPSDFTGRRPIWAEMVTNESDSVGLGGDVDLAPVYIPMPRDFAVPGCPPNKNPNWPYEHRQFEGEE